MAKTRMPFSYFIFQAGAEKLFLFLKVGEQLFIDKPRMTGVQVYLTALRLI
jgi:hypothetical protein